MLLSQVEQKIEIDGENLLNIRDGKMFFSGKGNIYKMGSKMFPIGKKGHIFTESLTEIGDYNEIQESIKNSNWKHRNGHCYSDADFLHQIFLLFEIDAKYFSGWVFPMLGLLPKHHAWVVVDENVYDISVHTTVSDKIKEQIEKGIDPKSPLAIKEIKNLENQIYPFQEHFSWGKVHSDMIYVGAESDPILARHQYSRLLDKFPNHPSYPEVSNHGTNYYRNEYLSLLDKA